MHENKHSCPSVNKYPFGHNVMNIAHSGPQKAAAYWKCFCFTNLPFSVTVSHPPLSTSPIPVRRASSPSKFPISRIRCTSSIPGVHFQPSDEPHTPGAAAPDKPLHARLTTPSAPSTDIQAPKPTLCSENGDYLAMVTARSSHTQGRGGTLCGINTLAGVDDYRICSKPPNLQPPPPAPPNARPQFHRIMTE